MGSSKHFIHDPVTLVLDGLRAAATSNPLAALDEENKVIFRREGDSKNVFLLSGGGSGHEPAFAGLVGAGFLDAAVAGTIFASPSAEQVRRAVMKYGKGRDVLIILMNYTGDVLNFGLAAEKAKSQGATVRMLIVGDDVAVERSKSGKVGRRGIAGTVLVQKVAGALAFNGESVDEVERVALLVSKNMASVGVSLGPVNIPGQSEGEKSLATNEIEIGMGIHNEPGASKSTLTDQNSLDPLIDTLLAQLLDTSDTERGFLHLVKDDTVVLLVNNLGGLSVLELGAITMHVMRRLESEYSTKPSRVFSGMFMTSLNSEAFSITLLKVVPTELPSGKTILDLLDAPVQVTNWPCSFPAASWGSLYDPEISDKNSDEYTVRDVSSQLSIDSTLAQKVISAGLSRLIEAEPEITRLDTALGDGDCGTGLKRGAESVISLVTRDKTTDALLLVSQIASSVEMNMDGTSGALYGIFLNAMASALRSMDSAACRKKVLTLADWAAVLSDALRTLQTYTTARIGDRTMMDTLEPFVEAFEATKNLEQAVIAAKNGCASTKGMKPKLGRSVYVGGNQWREMPDAGAFGLLQLILGLAEELNRS